MSIIHCWLDGYSLSSTTVSCICCGGCCNHHAKIDDYERLAWLLWWCMIFNYHSDRMILWLPVGCLHGLLNWRWLPVLLVVFTDSQYATYYKYARISLGTRTGTLLTTIDIHVYTPDTTQSWSSPGTILVLYRNDGYRRWIGDDNRKLNFWGCEEFSKTIYYR